MKFPYFTAEGTEDGERDYPSFINFEKNKGVDALRQVILAIRSNKRQGSASTKTRAEVRGSGKKIHRQKGLGAGRVGDKNAVQRRGGGVVFGPKPRSYNKKVNRKTKRLAPIRSACLKAHFIFLSSRTKSTVRFAKRNEAATLIAISRKS